MENRNAPLDFLLADESDFLSEATGTFLKPETRSWLEPHLSKSTN
jgi:hypothetical protein